MKTQNKKPRFYIGIDCGTKTGVAVWDSEKQKFLRIETKSIHNALFFVFNFNQTQWRRGILVLIENPNTFIPFKGREQANKSKLQGAGSIKRDYAIWCDALKDWGIAYEGTSLHASQKKMKPEMFAKVTDWEKRTSEHARDAAMIVFKR